MPLRLFSGSRSGSSQVVHAHRFVTTTGPGEDGEAPIWKRRKAKEHNLGRRHLRQVVVNDILRGAYYTQGARRRPVLCRASGGGGVDLASLNVKRRAEPEPDSWDGRRRYDRRYPQRCNPRIGI